MRLFILITFSFCVMSFVTAQTPTFDYTLNESNALVPLSAIEKDNKLYFSISSSNTFRNSPNARIMVLNQEGNIEQEKTFINDSLNLEIFTFIEQNEDFIIIGGGHNENNNESYIWYAKLGNDLQIIEQWFYPSLGQIAVSYSYLNENNIYVTGYSYDNLLSPFIRIFNLNGNLLASKDNVNISDVINRIEWNDVDSTYLLMGFNLWVLDKDFNEIEEIDVPFSLMPEGDLKKYKDSTYLVSGRHRVYNADYTEILGNVMGIGLMDKDYNGSVFSKTGSLGDTIYTVGAINSIDYTNENNIYFGGTSNVDLSSGSSSSIFGTLDSWFTLVQYDSLLNKRWEKSYGGDAYYNMFGLLATSDGGCVMYGFKHDYENNPNVLQLYILKVNENGDLITSTVVPVSSLDFKVYPNPFSQEITIELPETININDVLLLRVHDIQGKEIILQKVYNHKSVISLSSSLAAGFYIVSLEQNNQVIAKKKVVKN